MRAACLLPLALGACVETADRLGRDAAEATVARVLLAGFEGEALEIASRCITDNATAAEVRALASDGLLGPTPATRATIDGILARPETRSCFAANDLIAPARA